MIGGLLSSRVLHSSELQSIHIKMRRASCSIAVSKPLARAKGEP